MVNPLYIFFVYSLHYISEDAERLEYGPMGSTSFRFVNIFQVLFNGKTAIGVQYRLSDGTDSVVCVRKEVIVAAGAIRSPQLLQLSGIGPNDLLKQFNVSR